MKVIVPSYNNVGWIGRTLASLSVQDHPDFHVLVIDDASDDDGAELTEQLCASHGFDFQQNTTNMRAGYNLFTGIHAMEPAADEPVFILDGDDFLPHHGVLSRIEQEYSDPDVWFCYARYKPDPHNTGQVDSRPYPAEAMADAANGRLRNMENLANHPITFRYFLFDHLTENDMKNNRRRWLRAGYDRLMFIPMMEMASAGHVRFVDEVLYCYNAVNPISDTYANLADAQEAHRVVARRSPRKPLPEPLPHRTAVDNG